MPQLSASTLRIFQECPRCFWLHINKQIERPRGPFPSLPSGIDRILKSYFERYRARGLLPPLIDGKLDGKLATTALTLGFNDARTKARLWGRLDDCIVLADQRLVPLDHKTRSTAPDDLSYTQKYYQLQMDVYTLLLERAGHRTRHMAYVVYYVPLEGMLHEGFPFGVTVHQIDTDPAHAYEVFADACRCLAGSMPESSEACEFCRWAALRAARSGANPSATALAGRRSAGSQEAPQAARRGALARSGRAKAGRGTIPDDLFA
jgi:hypothetical protein